MTVQSPSVQSPSLSIDQTRLNSFVTAELQLRAPFAVDGDEEIHVMALPFETSGLEAHSALQSLVSRNLLLRFRLVETTEGSVPVFPDHPNCRLYVSDRLSEPILIAVRRRGPERPGEGERPERRAAGHSPG